MENAVHDGRGLVRGVEPDRPRVEWDRGRGSLGQVARSPVIATGVLPSDGREVREYPRGGRGPGRVPARAARAAGVGPRGVPRARHAAPLTSRGARADAGDRVRSARSVTCARRGLLDARRAVWMVRRAQRREGDGARSARGDRLRVGRGSAVASNTLARACRGTPEGVAWGCLAQRGRSRARRASIRSREQVRFDRAIVAHAMAIQTRAAAEVAGASFIVGSMYVTTPRRLRRSMRRAVRSSIWEYAKQRTVVGKFGLVRRKREPSIGKCSPGDGKSS